VSADLKEFRLSPLRCGNESLARACQDAAGRTSFDQLSFQFVLEAVSCRATVAWFTPKRRAAPRI